MINGRFWKGINFKSGLRLSILRNSLVDAINFTVYEKIRNKLNHF